MCIRDRATNTHMTLGQQLYLLAILMLTSKGAAGVTGSGFIVLAATLSAVGSVPVAGVALILGIDRFMSEARALTNLIGNGVDVYKRQVQFTFEYAGDATTPGVASTLDLPASARIAPEKAASLPKIPVTPLSYADACLLYTSSCMTKRTRSLAEVAL